MKRLSLQWRITLMTALLIGAACVSMKLLLCYSGIHYMDSIGTHLQGSSPSSADDQVIFFDPDAVGMDDELTIVIHGAQDDFCMTNWYITAAVTLLSGVLAYFVSGHALKPLRSFFRRAEMCTRMELLKLSTLLSQTWSISSS